MTNPIHRPIPKPKLIEELAKLKIARKTRRGKNTIYVFKAFEVPELFREVGRLRELTYRNHGGGTGRLLDEDRFDWRENAYYQVVIWSEECEEIVGGFRYGLGVDGDFATGNLYIFMHTYLNHYHNKTIDIGRMFIQPNYQVRGENEKGIFSMDNIWDGIGFVLSIHTDIEYLLGRIVSFRTDPELEQCISDFFIVSFGKKGYSSQTTDGIIVPKEPFFKSVVYGDMFEPGEVKSNYKKLFKFAKDKNAIITPLIFAYMNAATSIRYLGTVLDRELNVLESCIMVEVANLHSHFKKRHLVS